jgi:hypothetical protein
MRREEGSAIECANKPRTGEGLDLKLPRFEADVKAFRDLPKIRRRAIGACNLKCHDSIEAAPKMNA